MTSGITARERLWAAVCGHDIDRVPIWLYGIYPYNEPHWVTEDTSLAPLAELACEETDVLAPWAAASGPFHVGADGGVREDFSTWSANGITVWCYGLHYYEALVRTAVAMPA